MNPNSNNVTNLNMNYGGYGSYGNNPGNYGGNSGGNMYSNFK